MNTLLKQSTAGFGVLYLGIGAEYTDLCLNSISYLRKAGYTGPVRLVTNCNVELKSLSIEVVNSSCGAGSFESRTFKTSLYTYGFRRTLFLDSDTVPLANVATLPIKWYTDIAMAIDLHPTVAHVLEYSSNDPVRREPEYRYTKELNLLEHPYYNSGVLYFKKSKKIERLFRAWHSEWQKFGAEDQLALVRALASQRVKVAELPYVWNARPRAFHSIAEAQEKGVNILHFLSRQRGLMESFGVLNFTGGKQ